MILHGLYFGALEEPMTLITVLGVIDNFELGDRHVFSCEIAFIHKELSLDYYGITGDFLSRLIEIARDNIDVVDLLVYAVSEHLDFEQFLSSLLDLIIGPLQEEIVDCGCYQAKYDHENTEDGHTLEDINKRDQILEYEEGSSHRVK
jgi:hypothetical protein